MSSPSSSFFRILELPCDVLDKITESVGPENYRFVAGACRGLRDSYLRTHPDNFRTGAEGIVGSVHNAEIYLIEQRRGAGVGEYDFYHVALWASRYGQLPVLKWVCNISPRFVPSSADRLLGETAEGGHYDCFDFLTGLGYDFSSSGVIRQSHLAPAVRNDQLVFLIRFHAKGCDMTHMGDLCNMAAASGHLDVLRFLHETAGCPWDSRICSSAARSGHIDCLKYARKNGCSWNVSRNGFHISCEAAAGGSIVCMEYLHEQGCQLDSHAYVAAAAGGHVDCLQYLHDKGTAMHEELMMNALLEATRFGHLNCIKFLLRINAGLRDLSNLGEVLSAAAARGHADCLAFLVDFRRTEWEGRDLTLALQAAVSNGSLDCLAYLLEMDYTWSRAVLYDAAGVAFRCGEKDCFVRLLELNVDWDRGRFYLQFRDHHPSASSCGEILRAYLLEHGYFGPEVVRDDVHYISD